MLIMANMNYADATVNVDQRKEKDFEWERQAKKQQRVSLRFFLHWLVMIKLLATCHLFQV